MNVDDAQKLAALWVSAQSDVATFIKAFIRNSEDANDVLQQVAMKIVRKFDKYDQTRPFSPWVIAVAKREVFTYLRRQSADRHVFDDDLVHRIADVIEQRIGDDDLYESALRDCVEKSDPRGQRVLDLHYGKGVKTATIAEDMSMTPGAVRMLLCRVREELRQCIEERLSQQGGV